MLSHANLWLGAISVAHYLGLTARDRTLAVLPLAFDYGQNQLLSTWAAGGHAIAFDYLLPRDVVRAVGRHGVTVLAGVPPLWIQLAELDWAEGGSASRTLTNSGGHLPETLVRKLRSPFPQAKLHLMYGLTEAFRSTSLDPALADEHPDSVGAGHPLRRSDDRPRRRQRSRAGRGGRAGPRRAAGRAGLLAGLRAHRERFKPAPSFSQLRRHGRLVRRYGGPGRRRPDPLPRPGRRDDQGQRQPPEPDRDRGGGPRQRSGAAKCWPSGEGRSAWPGGEAYRGREGRERRAAAAGPSSPRSFPPTCSRREIVWRDELPVSPNGKVDRAALLKEFA